MSLNRSIFPAILGLFVSSAVLATESSPSAEAERKLDAMSAAEKDDLRRRHERFERLSDDERRRLRTLEADLAKDPDGERLREVMLRYQEWLGGLPPSQRSEILGTPVDERISRIKNRLAEQDKRRREALASQSINREDIGAIRTWMKPIFNRSESSLLDKLSPDQRDRWERVPEPGRFGAILGAAIWKQRSDNYQWQLTSVMGVTDQECDELVQRLSTTARDAYKKAAADKDRKELVESWMRAAVFHEMMRFKPHEVRSFADRHESKASSRMRDELDYLPPYQMRTEIEGMLRERGKGPPGGFPPFPPQKGDSRRGEKER